VAADGTPPGGWLPVADVAELSRAAVAGRPVSVRLFGAPWALTILDGVPVVLPDRCPHRRVPLSAGRVVETPGGQRLECAYHGWQFDRSGACRHIPALAGTAVPAGMRAAAPAGVVERHGLVWASWRAQGPFPDAAITARLARSAFGAPAVAFVPVGLLGRSARDVVAVLGPGPDPARLPTLAVLAGPGPAGGPPVAVAVRPVTADTCALYATIAARPGYRAGGGGARGDGAGGDGSHGDDAGGDGARGGGAAVRGRGDLVGLLRAALPDLDPDGPESLT
jgi:nitrite reductase/ring-hydroxylating ferredoxin subunit